MKKYCFGIDVGGTTVKMGLFTTEGELLDKWEIPTRKEDGGAYILNDVAASVEAKLRISKRKMLLEQESVFQDRHLILDMYPSV